jgi:hypothetical protein
LKKACYFIKSDPLISAANFCGNWQYLVKDALCPDRLDPFLPKVEKGLLDPVKTDPLFTFWSKFSNA